MDLSGAEIGAEKADAARSDLASLDARTAARVAGSQARRDAILDGKMPKEVFNEGRPKAYRIGGIGDARLEDVKQSDYEIAKSGGRNFGLYKRFKDVRAREIEKSIRSLEKRIAIHEDKIRNPDLYLDPGCTKYHRDDLINRYWPEEISDYRQQIVVLLGILGERKNGKS